MGRIKRVLIEYDRVLIDAEFDPGLTSVIKSISGHKWMSSRTLWSVPLKQLSNLVGLLPECSSFSVVDGYLQELRREGEEHRTKMLKLTGYVDGFDEFPDKPLMEHQITGVKSALIAPHFGILDEMGTGKSRQALILFRILIQNNIVDRCLIVCKNRNKYTWADDEDGEIPQWAPGYEYQVLKRKDKIGLFRILIINYENMWARREEFVKMAKDSRLMMIFDEPQMLGNHGSQRTRACVRIGEKSAMNVLLTGTYQANKLESVWSILKLLYPDGAENYTEFVKKYCVTEQQFYGGNNFFVITGYKNVEALSGRIQARSIRRLKKDCLDLPEKLTSVASCALEGEQKAAYETMERELYSELMGMDEQTMRVEATNILSKMTRLMQLACDPGLISGEPYDNVSKLKLLLDIVDDIMAESNGKNKIIIWSCYINMINRIAKTVSGYGSVILHGKISEKKGAENIKLFRSDPCCRILVVNPAVGREGLTLVEANTNIYHDRNFSLLNWTQSQDRTHRKGQTKKCYNIILQADNTIDEVVHKALIDKEVVYDKLTGDGRMDEIKSIHKFKDYLIRKRR